MTDKCKDGPADEDVSREPRAEVEVEDPSVTIASTVGDD